MIKGQIWTSYVFSKGITLWVQKFTVYITCFTPYYRWMKSEFFAPCLEGIPSCYGGCALVSRFCPWQSVPTSLVLSFLLGKNEDEVAGEVPTMAHIGTLLWSEHWPWAGCVGRWPSGPAAGGPCALAWRLAVES